MLTRRILLASAVASLTLPCFATAQARKVYRVGVLSYLSPEDLNRGLQTFRMAVADHGFVEGRNVVFVVRTADGKFEALSGLAADLIRHDVDVIFAIAPLSIRAARSATASTPIVMAYGDPAMFTSLARPGGNVTGVVALAAELAGKQLELLQEAVPRLTRGAVLRNPDQPVHVAKLKRVEEVARSSGISLVIGDARTADDFDAAFLTFASARAEGLIVLADGMFQANRARIAALCLRTRLPAVYGLDHADAGGLICYVPDTAEVFRRGAWYVAKILGGANPGTLPVEQPTKFHLIVNLKTAKALGLAIPASLLLRADQMIE